ncbi:MAG: oligopeptide transporter, OPT family [Acidobacteria bacterium]|nr:oligopeptide transporter, OPT family [Acidobacteriota bacterium]
MTEEQKPYVPADSTMPELTVKAVVLGVLMAAVLGAANAYLGVKAGQTVSATFPAAVLAIAAFRLPFLRGNVLEQNIARTAASVGEALVAGAIFTIPAFVMVSVDGQRLWTEFNYWETSFILLIGGLLGIFFIILLRRTLTIDSGLPFPESRACAEIVKAGQGGETGAKYVFGAMGLGMLLQVFKDGAGLRLFQESVEFVKQLPASVIKHFDSSRHALGEVSHGGAIVAATPAISPALIGVGYVIGYDLAAVNFSGGLLAWLVFIPLALFLNPDLSAQLAASSGHTPDTSELVFSIWYNQIRPVAVGAMLVGAVWTLWKMRTSIGNAFRAALRKGSAVVGEQTRLDRDLDLRTILIGTVLLVVPMTAIYYHFSHSVVGAAVAAVVMLVLGFLFSAVGGYLVGLVGGSNQPISGLALSTLIVAALLMVGFGVKGLAGVGAVLGVAAVVCCACAVSGDMIQDLKAGQLLGGSPRAMQFAELISTVVVAFVLVFPIMILHKGNILQGGIGIGDRALPAPQAGLMAQLAQGIVGGEMPWGLILFGMFFSVGLILIKAPSPMLIAVGMYLPLETTGAIFLGGCIKKLVETLAKRRKLDETAATRVENTGTLVASGLIAGESLTGVLLSGVVLAVPGFVSITRSLFGVDEFAWVAGPAGGWASLLALGAIVWILVRIPLSKARG